MQTNNAEQIVTFPTGKPHISYSEVKTWQECPWKHKLLYIDKVGTFETNENLLFGTITHAECEDYLLNNKFDTKRAISKFNAEWKKHNFGNVDQWIKECLGILEDIPEFLLKTFPDWKCLKSEYPLYESIQDSDIKFKGFVDGVIRAKNKRGHDVMWIIDWKTTSSRGWSADKKQDPLVQAQIVLYKSYISEKFNIDPKDIKCGFVLLKRGAKKGKSCELIEIAAGPKTLEKANKLVSSMIVGVKSGVCIKNRMSCTYCEFKETAHCPGSNSFKPFTS